MSGVSDETLMAYADGELTGEQGRAVEQFIAANPSLAKRLAVFEETGRKLGAMLDDAIPAALPPHLLNAVTAPPAASVSNAVPFRKAPPVVAIRRKPWAIAAGLALVAGSVSWWLGHTPSPQRQGIDLASVVDQSGNAREGLRLALETVASGSESKVAGLNGANAVIRPDFTFLAKSGAFCRQYRLIERASAVAGVACRSTEGVWHAERHVSANVPVAKKDGQIVPAGHETPKELDALVDEMISGDVLGAGAESDAIRNGWHKAHGQSLP